MIITGVVTLNPGTSRWKSNTCPTQGALTRLYRGDVDRNTRVAIPEFWRRNYGPASSDIRHNLAATVAFELPFGQGKRWGTRHTAALLLGGWQLNTVAALHTGFPVTPTANAAVLNAPGNSNFADCLGPVKKIGNPIDDGILPVSPTRIR